MGSGVGFFSQIPNDIKKLNKRKENVKYWLGVQRNARLTT